MKFLIVAGDSVIFQQLAQELFAAIGESHEVEVATESAGVGALKVFRQRIRKSGLLRGIDQFAFKAFDLFFLRRQQERSARRQWNKSIPVARIPPLNSPAGVAHLRQGHFDAVICIASSIIGKEALATPKHGFINIHPGVLPLYRGTGNLWAVLNRDWENIGCTVHWMTEKIDAGKIIAIERLQRIPASLWDIHIEAMRVGIAALARIIRSGSLPDAQVDVSAQSGRYYGWYGFIDYIRFAMILAGRRK